MTGPLASIRDDDPKSLWKKINWKGDISNNNLRSPVTEELAVYFESLYGPRDPDEELIIKTLQSPVTVPSLDKPISHGELEKAIKDMKKGVTVLRLTVLRYSPPSYRQYYY